VLAGSDGELDRRRLRGLITLVRRHLAHTAWLIETGRVDSARELIVGFDGKLAALQHYEREARAASGEQAAHDRGA